MTKMIDMTAVETLFNHYHKKSATKPNFYASIENCVTVTLPQELLGFANAAAGHSGFGAGARPVGIRRNCVNSKETIKEIFSSVDSLAEFIMSSECNAEEYIQNIKRKHAKKAASGVAIDDRPADSNFSVVLKKVNVQELVAKFGKEALLQARKVLTINEFELRFGIK